MTESLPDPDVDRFPKLAKAHTFGLVTQHLLVRIYQAVGDHPLRWDQFRRFGPTTGRFDHHPVVDQKDHPDHGVWYGALEKLRSRSALTTVVAETFQDTRVVPLGSRQRWLVITAPARPLHLLSLDSSWITRAGGNAAIRSGPRSQARKWARAIHLHYPEVDGLIWSSSVYPPGTAIALWERRDSPSPFDLPLLNRPLADLTHYLVAAAEETGFRASL